MIEERVLEMLLLDKVFLFKIKALLVFFVVFIFLSGCSENTMELIFHEDGSVEYNAYVGINKEIINDDIFRESFQNFEYIDEPMENPYFFFDDWGGDTYEIWKRQVVGVRTFLSRRTRDDIYPEYVLSDLVYFSTAFTEVFEEILGFTTSFYEDDKIIGFVANKRFSDVEAFKSFSDRALNSFEEYFGEVSYEDETWVDDFDIAREITYSIILYSDRIFNRININDDEIMINISNVSHELSIPEIRNLLRIIEEDERFSFPKDLLQRFSGNLRIKTNIPVLSHNAPIVSEDRMMLEWDVINSLLIRMHMRPQIDEEPVEKGILGTVFLLVFFALVIIGVVVYVDTKKNPEKGVLSKLKKKEW